MRYPAAGAGVAASSGSARNGLLAALERRLVPELARRGFESVPLDAEDRRAGEIRKAFPFGRCRRRGQQGYDQVEIQIDKRSGDAFRLNFAAVPAAGIPHPAGHVRAEDAWIHYLERYCTLYRHPLFRTWFSPRGWWGFGAGSDIAAPVDEAIALLPEIDAFFAEGKIGPHVRCV
ncbi:MULTISPECIES: hypothetical protein [unclassified Lysobacter]|uniref:hypothetical protein n=1 Tax=unclassified Lysobacter TaxID=2635362 RepID=UPI00307ED5A7